jgi:hypothetical protein
VVCRAVYTIINNPQVVAPLGIIYNSPLFELNFWFAVGPGSTPSTPSENQKELTRTIHHQEKHCPIRYIIDLPWMLIRPRGLFDPTLNPNSSPSLPSTRSARDAAQSSSLPAVQPRGFHRQQPVGSDPWAWSLRKSDAVWDLMSVFFTTKRQLEVSPSPFQYLQSRSGEDVKDSEKLL